MNYKRLKGDEIKIPSNGLVSVKEMGKVVEIVYNQRVNKVPHVLKLDKDHYAKIKTGEILEFKHKSENRSQSVSSLRKTFKKIAELIQTNVIDNSKVRWVTLTYKENMIDTIQLYNDFRKFIQKFNRYCKKMGFENVEYIAIFEPQGRGAWHCHIIFIFNKLAPFIPNNDLEKIWGHGFTKIQKIDNGCNIVPYLTAYLSDMEISEEMSSYFENSSIKRKEIDGTKKYYVKGARLSMYPNNFNIIRHSRGIKYPERKTMRVAEAMKLVENKKLKYRTTYRLSNEEGYSTVIDKREYQ